MNESVNESMGAIIARKRKKLGMTQEQLAGALGISYQAVSKWENELSSPDISTLPLLADVLGLSLDELFGRAPMQPEEKTLEEPEQAEEELNVPPEVEECALAVIPAAEYGSGASVELPWPDDNTLHAVLFVGHQLLGQEKAGGVRKVVLHYEGDALNVQSVFDVNVEGEVRGSVHAEGDVNCEDVGGSATAGGDISCGDVGGDLCAGGDITCGEVSGHVQAGGDVNCDNVEGSVHAGGDVNCGKVSGGVRAEGDVNCDGIADDGEFHSNLKDKKRGFSFELKL